MNVRLPSFVVVIGVVAVLAMPPVATSAATVFNVTKTDDTADGACDSDCSLREAIIAANAAPGADTINLPAGTYTLTIAGQNEDASQTGDLDVTDDLTLTGAGADTTIIQACDGSAGHCVPIDRVLDLIARPEPVKLALSGVTIQNGDPDSAIPTAQPIVWGGGIQSAGDLTITNSTTRNNVGAGGGGIVSSGSLTMTDTTISGNKAVNFSGAGGGIISQGDALLERVTVSGNDARFVFGGISNEGTMIVRDSLISDNTAFEYASGIGSSDTLTVENTTFTHDGMFSAGRLTLSHSQISGSGILIGVPNTRGGPSSALSQMQGVSAEGGTLNSATLSDVTIQDGGIFNAIGGQLTMTHTSILRGGVTNNGLLTIAASTIADAVGSGIVNITDFNGIVRPTPELTVYDSTVGGNVGSNYGAGGIENWQGSVWLTNVTISGNSNSNASDYNEGGGIRNVNNSTMVISNSTIASNTAASAGGIFNDNTSTLTLANTIIAGNSGGDCSGAASTQGYNAPGPVTSLGHNLISDDTCALSGTGDLNSTDPILGPLANNGGPTETQALLSGSPAIDAGDPAGCADSAGAILVDQRLHYRPADGDANNSFICDIGAFEYGAVDGLPGDANCDDHVDASDALLALKIGSRLSNDRCGGLADVDCDGYVGAPDALRILAYAAGVAGTPTSGCSAAG